jgi:enoyl-CoA hydratase/carnithine racemase
LIFSGRAFSASEALDWGLINRLCEPRTVVEESIACAERISTSAPLSVRQAKKSIHRGLQTDLNTGYRIELELYYKLLDTEDRTEGVRAFNEKRRPIFRGR